MLASGEHRRPDGQVAADAPKVEILDLGPAASDFRTDALAGLTRPGGKRLPPKYFYDQVGSALFQAITGLDEYYLTRAELSILASCGPELAQRCGPHAVLVEYGSGAGLKTRLLLDRLDRPAAYVPIDISYETLREAALALQSEHPSLSVLPVCADYTGELRLPTLPEHRGRCIGFFPGSTIGNFEPREATAFLTRAAALVGAGGALILGADLKKDAETLVRAYDDPVGVTAAFNKNVLARMNRELGADFDVRAFRHVALYDAEAGRIQMHLESDCDQVATMAGMRIYFAKGERIHTENSYKFSVDDIALMAEGTGFAFRGSWTDPMAMCGLHWLDAIDTLT